ncbi:hypothetical protein COLO4_01438 [Corchorus olitorius]|uniref:DUF4283 domain-containing protein n=1 Tax=Corchorus olitorius TaxID=93759 RepID=A0A1R3L2I9_9ROSI|nr:hypothetical protein COLO4_01438 [Corchorus olitorius]
MSRPSSSSTQYMKSAQYPKPMQVSRKIRSKDTQHKFHPYKKKAVSEGMNQGVSRKTIKRSITRNLPKPPIPPPKTLQNHMERIQGKRECSWSNSESSSEDSDEDMTSPYNNQPVPEVRTRALRDPIVQPNLSNVPNRREYWQKCLVAVLKDFRKFSTHTLQRHINREWRLRGGANVLGREGNTYLIELTEDIDRNYAVQESPWLLDGAMLVTVPWRPNTGLRNVEIRHTHMWVQLWGMPLEYFQEEIARSLAAVIGPVERVDWDNRNIRFIRVRVLVDLTRPLIPSCSMVRDDGVRERIRFRYERVAKFCKHCGFIGHTHPHCPYTNTEVERMLNEQMEEVTHNLGHGIIYEVQQHHFSDDIRAYHRRRHRRNTTIIYRNGQRPNQGAKAAQHQQEARNGDHEMPPDENRPRQHSHGNNNEENGQQQRDQAPEMQMTLVENGDTLPQINQHQQQQSEMELMSNQEGTNDNLPPLPEIILNLSADVHQEHMLIAEILGQAEEGQEDPPPIQEEGNQEISPPSLDIILEHTEQIGEPSPEIQSQPAQVR